MKKEIDRQNRPALKAHHPQVKIPISCDFKILSIDGGGIKGLYAATLLAQVEDKIGAPIGSYFDMICGTSTGGLIALAITNGIPCRELERFYVENGPVIFPREGWVKRKRRQVSQFVTGTKYNNTGLREALVQILSDSKTMADADHLICIPAFNVTKGRPTVFKKPFGPYHRDGRFTMLEVAMATSAAPTYFPAVQIENDQYVDGGIIANNPSLIGFTEAVDHFLGRTVQIANDAIKYDQISLLSIGLPSALAGQSPDASSERSFLEWEGDLMGCSMVGASYLANYQTGKLINAIGGSSYYYRLDPPPLSVPQLKHVDMDNTSPVAIQTMISYGQDVGDHFTSSRWHEVKQFFKSPKSYKF